MPSQTNFCSIAMSNRISMYGMDYLGFTLIDILSWLFHY